MDMPSAEGLDTLTQETTGNQDQLTQEQLPQEETAELPQEENQEGSEGSEAIPAKTVTAENIADGSVSFDVLSTAEGGDVPAAGASPVMVTLPYGNLTPVSGALHVMDSTGGEAAYLNIDPSEKNLTLLDEGGSTTLLMLPYDTNDREMQTDFEPVSGTSYTYTLDAIFHETTEEGEQQVSVQLYNVDPYHGNSVTEEGFSLDGSCMNVSGSDQITGSVLFPADGSAGYATVSADMADVSVTNGTDGSVVNGVTAGAGDVVNIVPQQTGFITLTITYFAQDPNAQVTDVTDDAAGNYEVSTEMDPMAAGDVNQDAAPMNEADVPVEPVGTAYYTIYVN